MNQGKTPCDRRVDSYISMMVKDKNGKDELWQPHNANGYFTGDSVTLKSAFAQSINSIAVKVGLEDGIENVIKTAKAMGIKSPLDNTPSLSLGSSDVSLEELVSAYCTAVDDGVQRDPVLVTKIVDRDGNTIYTNPAENKQAIPYRTAFLMQQMLMAGMTEPGGTSMSLWGYVSPYARDTDFGGKTGTSSNHSDAWFVGISPNLVAGAWVGGEYRCIHFRTGALGQGSRTALPICGYFFQSVFNDPHFRQYHAKFAKPKEYIDPAAYTCQACYKQRVTNDSTAVSGDSTAVQEGGGDEGLKNNNTDEEKQSEDVNPENELN
jgi:penicillin-binding protein 1A